MTLNEYQKLAMTTLNPALEKKDVLINGVMGLCGEAGEAIDIVKDNARTTGFFDKCRYLASDYRNYIRKASGRERFDLVFIDPPYAMECALDAAKRLREAGLLSEGAIVVLESGEEEIDLSEAVGFEVIKSTHYGKKSFVNILLHKESEQ
jgi:16S rRNA G966 N2-methylase RsmD